MKHAGESGVPLLSFVAEMEAYGDHRAASSNHFLVQGSGYRAREVVIGLGK